MKTVLQIPASIEEYVLQPFNDVVDKREETSTK